MAFVTKTRWRVHRSLCGFQQGFQNKQKDKCNQNFSSRTSETWQKPKHGLHLTKEHTHVQGLPLVFKAQCRSCQLCLANKSQLWIPNTKHLGEREIHPFSLNIYTQFKASTSYAWLCPPTPEQSSSHNSDHVWIKSPSGVSAKVTWFQYCPNFTQSNHQKHLQVKNDDSKERFFKAKSFDKKYKHSPSMPFSKNKTKIALLSDSQTLLTWSGRKMNYQQANCRELTSSFVKSLSASI